MSGYGNHALSGIQQGLAIGDHIFGAAGRRRQQALQEQQQIMALQDSQAMREHQAALRPLQISQLEAAKKQQELQQLEQDRKQKAKDAYMAAQLMRARGGEIDDDFLSGVTDFLGRRYGEDIDNDKSGKTPAGFIPYRSPEDKEAKEAYGLLLNVPQEGMDPRLAPLTRARGSDPDDEVRLFTPEIFNQIGRENEWLIKEVLGDLPTSISLSPALAGSKPRYDSDEVLKLLAEAAGITPQKKYGKPYKLGDSYVQDDADGRVSQVASDWRGETNDTKLKIARERNAAILKNLQSKIDADLRKASVSHTGDPQKVILGYVKDAMKMQVMGEGGWPRQPTPDEAFDVASEMYHKALKLAGRAPALNDGSEKPAPSTAKPASADGALPPKPIPTPADTKPVTAPKPKSASYQEYLDAFNATKDPKKRQAINARAREMGIIK